VMLPKREIICLNDHSNAVFSVVLNAQGEYLLSGSQDKTIKLYNAETGGLIQTYVGHGKEVSSVAVANDNTRFASCGGEKLVYYWDVTTSQILRKFEGHLHQVNSVDFNKEASILASASYDATVRLWDCRSSSFEPIQKLTDAKDSVTSIKITPFGILTGSVDGFVRDYDIRMGILREDEIGPPVTSVNISGDDNCILISTLDNTIRLLDRVTGHLLSSYSGHANEKYKLQSVFTYNDAYIVSGSEDGTIHFWELVQAKQVQVLKAHTKAVTGLAYHPKQHFFVSSSLDGKIKLWGL